MGPLVIGLTGSIGTGKSHVLNTLVSLGAEGIDADQVAHDVMLPGGAAFEAVLSEFSAELDRGSGDGLLASDGTIDRRRLGQRVFANPAALARLEAIVHPAVHQAIKARVEASQAPAVVIEAIKLIEANLSRSLCDQVWVTAASEANQLARLETGRNMSVEEVRRRIANQMPQNQMVAQADRVICTDGTQAETELAVLAAWVELELPLPDPTIRRATLDDAEGTASVLNSVVLEGGLTIAGRTFTPDEERAFLLGMPPRSFLTAALLGRVVVGFQTVEPYATFTQTMDHVASMGTYVVAPVRGCGLGRAMSAATWEAARATGYSKFVITVRDDNPSAQAFYLGLGFQPCGRLSKQAFVDGIYVDELLYELFL